MNNRRRVAMALFIAMALGLGSLGTAQGQEQKYVSITELREAIKEGWHQTYQDAYGRNVRIDAEIVVPDVQELPVVRYGYSDVTYDIPEGMASETDSVPGGFALQTDCPAYIDILGNQTQELRGTDLQEEFQRRPWDDGRAYAAENPFTFGQAKDWIGGLLEKITDGKAEFSVENLIVKRRFYRVKAGEMEKPFAQGFYQLDLYQTFHGVPLMQNSLVTAHPTHSKGAPVMGGTAFIASEEAFLLGLSFFQEEGTVAEDVPVLSFEEVLPLCEKLVTDGYVRDVARVELGYIGFLQKGVEDEYIAYPCWMLTCQYQQDPKAEVDKYFVDNPIAANVQGICQRVLINAQTGELFPVGFMDKELHFCPEVLGWEDVNDKP